ncbi:MAG: alpha/beta hydrolase [Chitinophagaceae bacterium]|nr:alpha/beta hydrolase [Chitinophagaceae bacterium]
MTKQNTAKPLNRLFTRPWLLFSVCFFLSAPLKAQFNVTIQLKSVPASHNNDLVFISGNFNNWNPDNDRLLLKNKMLSAVLKNLDAGTYEFKFTRGRWDNVECTADGKDVENHSVQINSDTTLEYSIDGWKDDFAQPVRPHTASFNVKLLDAAFEIPQLKRNRRIWIYFPPGYNITNKHYPVMYMQDGQNLFDEVTAAYGEWGVDECLDLLVNRGKPGCIVIGIENGGATRMSEYNPFEFTWRNDSSSKAFTPEGDAYLDFIIHTLKPYVDKHYRTLTSKENTIIAGSSMGGLIAYYAVLKHPDVFGKAGVFSPAFWTANGIDSLTDILGDKLKGKYFFYSGGKEGYSFIDDVIRIQEKVGKNSSAMVYSFIDSEAGHNEHAWRKWFAEFYCWIMADGFNVITSGENQSL